MDGICAKNKIQIFKGYIPSFQINITTTVMRSIPEAMQKVIEMSQLINNQKDALRLQTERNEELAGELHAKEQELNRAKKGEAAYAEMLANTERSLACALEEIQTMRNEEAPPWLLACLGFLEFQLREQESDPTRSCQANQLVGAIGWLSRWHKTHAAPGRTSKLEDTFQRACMEVPFPMLENDGWWMNILHKVKSAAGLSQGWKKRHEVHCD